MNKKLLKLIIDANCHDGEDRSGCKNDKMAYNPDSFQEEVEMILEIYLEKRLEQYLVEIGEII
ncbi:hypothetical protein N9064_00515 [bacterium]|nr:hypothetical protein [bacterium]